MTEAFLLLYPLSALSVGGKSGWLQHDASVESVSFTLAIQVLWRNSLAFKLSMPRRGGGGVKKHAKNKKKLKTKLNQKKTNQFLLYLFVCLLFLGMAEVAGSLEDPFAGGHLPVEDMVRTTVRDVARARREAARVRVLGVGGFNFGGGRGAAAAAAAAAAAVYAAAGEKQPPPAAALPSLPPLSALETVDWAGAEALCGRLKG